MTEKQGPSWVPKLLDFFTDLLALAKSQTEEEIEQLKKRLVQNIIVYGIFMVALLFVLIGLVKYFSAIGIFSEGIGFMITGGILIVLLATYTMINRI